MRNLNTVENQKVLTIYNASAGSGKTFHLVQEFISLLITEKDSKSTFAQILAMTFTNKAALEMKVRIIGALDEIGSYEGTVVPILGNELVKKLNLPIEEIAQRCRKVLNQILHQYENFNVMTIDKFNLRLIKSFARDLDLPVDFEVVLDESLLIEQVVDEILNKLGTEGSEELGNLIIHYAEFNLSEGKQWSFRKSLIEFGSILRDEKNIKITEQLLSLDLSIEEFHKLKKKKKVIDEEFVAKIDRLKKIISDENIDPDLLPGKSITFKSINKHNNDAEFPVKQLFTDGLSDTLDKELNTKQYFPDLLKNEIRSIMHFYDEKLEEYLSLQLYLRNFFNIALLKYIAQALIFTRNENNVIRISEFNSLISNLIQGESTPFIYERLGNRFNHFLLDEFQDTSRMQWLNLVPLIHDSLGNNNRNLIVGDPKQSIYRFKNGVAEQFVALPGIYNPEGDSRIAGISEYFSAMGGILNLEDNWRSSPLIVNFNNDIFSELRDLLPTQSRDFYNSVRQNPKSKKSGGIYIESLAEKRSSQELIPMILNWVKMCLDEGYQPGDICILGSVNKECNTWAIALNDAGYNVVSADSLLVDSDIEVQLCVGYLRWRMYPESEHAKKRFAELFFRLKSDNYDVYRQYLIEIKSENEKSYRRFDADSFLRKYFNGKESFFFKYESLYDLIQGFYQLIGFKELNNPYLHHFSDFVFEFNLKKGPNLKLLLDEYENKKNSLAVQIPESSDSVQIMTMHKSKGLEFPVVIIPSLDFNISKTSHFLIEHNDYLLYKIPSSNEKISVLAEMYVNEISQVITDKANLCYVALTRAEERLFVGNYYVPKSFGALFHNALSKTKYAKADGDKIIVELKEGKKNTEATKDNTQSIFRPSEPEDYLWFPDIALQDHGELLNPDFLNESIQYGKQLHLLISRITKSEMIETVVTRSIDAGEISNENCDRFKNDLFSIFNSKSHLDLFDNAINIISEQDIIDIDGAVFRPDRIIIKENETIIVDYKTGIPNKKDPKQVNTYKGLLDSMGYQNLSCYLYYTSINELQALN